MLQLTIVNIEAFLMDNSSAKIRWILGVLLLAALIIGGSFLYTRVAKKPISPIVPILIPPSQKTTDTQPGVKTAQKMLADYPQFVKRTFIQQQIEGTLKATTENSWTIEVSGKSLTLTNESTNKIHFTKLPKTATSGTTKTILPTEIKPEEMKVGDLVSINQLIDWQTGKVIITGITVLPPK